MVNKPAGLDSVPWAESRQRRRFTLQSYLPTVVPPPTRGEKEAKGSESTMICSKQVVKALEKP